MTRFKNFLNRFFVPRRDYIVTPILFYINFSLYVFVSIYDNNFWIPSEGTIISLGADAPFLTLDGQWWRLFTACFLHFGIIHIAANMLALIQLGFILEKFVGSVRLLFGYLFCGIAGNIASDWWYSDTASTVSVGASGAIFGLLGFFLALVTTEFVKKESRASLLKSIGLTILINVLISLDTRINSAAHYGGLVAGIFCGYLVWILYKLNSPSRVTIFSILITLFTASSIFFILPVIPKDSVKLFKFQSERIIMPVTELDSTVTAVSNREPVSDEKAIMFVQQWNDLIGRTDSMRHLTKSDDIEKDISRIKTDIILYRELTLLNIRRSNGDSTALIPIELIKERLGEK